MRITLDQLASQPRQTIDLLEILSIEGQHYMARLSSGDEQWLLSDENGNTSLFRSAWQLQETLANLTIRETRISHPSAYHEMIGMEPEAIEPLNIRVQTQQANGRKA